MSLICEIRTKAPRLCNTLLILAGFLRVLFALSILVAAQLGPACGQGTMQTPTKSASDGPLRSQHFVCNVGYSRDLCHQQTVKLAKALLLYQHYLPDNWTWVLVRSDDWPTILEGLNLHPGGPAFSVLAKRQDFLNEVLMDGTVQDRAESYSVPSAYL